MNIAVVDGGSDLVSHVRMDGAWIGSIDISTADLSKNAQPVSNSMASTIPITDGS